MCVLGGGGWGWSTFNISRSKSTFQIRPYVGSIYSKKFIWIIEPSLVSKKCFHLAWASYSYVTSLPESFLRCLSIGIFGIFPCSKVQNQKQERHSRLKAWRNYLKRFQALSNSKTSFSDILRCWLMMLSKMMFFPN